MLLLFAAIAMLCLAANGGAQPRGTARSSSEIQKARWSNLRGMTVENRDGEALGVVKDFIIDMPAGDVRYAVISTGTILGLRSTRKIVPLLALSDATAKTRILALDVSTRRWKKAPQFRKSDLGRLQESQRAAQISTFYSPAPRQAQPAKSQTANGHGPLSATGRGGEDARPPVFELAGEIVGRTVTNQQQKGIGHISDLLIDLDGHKQPFAIISKAKLLQKHESYAVPLRLLSQSSDHLFKLEADSVALGRAQPFSEEAWQTTADASASIYRYVEK